MTKQEIIDYMYENHVQGDFKIEETAEDLSQPQWIPCSERLPEYYGNYLVSVYDNEEPDIGTIDPEEGRWSLCDAGGFYWADSKGLKVKAWMPLPEPYKGEEE